MSIFNRSIRSCPFCRIRVRKSTHGISMVAAVLDCMYHEPSTALNGDANVSLAQLPAKPTGQNLNCGILFSGNDIVSKPVGDGSNNTTWQPNCFTNPCSNVTSRPTPPL